MTDDRGRLDRRRFLLLAAGGGAAVVVGLGLKLGLGDGDPQTTGGAGPSPAAAPDAAAEAVGRRYLEETPAESTEADLRAALPDELADVQPGEETARLSAAVHADFDQGRTIELDGWLLSVTECRVAALSAVA